MRHEDFCYVGYKSNLRSKTKVYKLDELDPPNRESKVEHFRTVYRFNKDILKYESVAGLSSDIHFFADYLPIDIDRDKLDEAKAEKDKIEAFLEEYEIGFETWFSGNKGYHILIPTVQFNFEPTNDEDVLHKMALAISGVTKVEIDTTIYNATRVLRMPYSYHEKSGNRKIPMAEYPDCDDHLVNDKLCELYEAVLKSLERAEKDNYTQTNEAPGVVFRHVSEGRRNAECYLTAKKLRERKFQIDEAYRLLEFWNQRFVSPPLSEQEIKRTLKSAYTGSVQTIIKDPDLTTYSLDVGNTLQELRKEYQDIDKYAVKTGYKFIDNYTMGFIPGELIFWLAVNGNLKTCILSNWMAQVSRITGKYTIIFSMDMSGKALAMRHIQAAEKQTYRDVRDGLIAGEDFVQFRNIYQKVVIVDKKSINVDDAKRYCDWFRENRGEIGFIGFDYLGAFRGCDNDHKVTGDTVHALSNLAGEISYCPVICLVQARREYEGQGGNVEIDKQAGKDTSAIEHKGDYIIGSWWHEDERPEGIVRKYWGRFLKNRKFDSEKYPDNAYFSLAFEKKFMYLRDIQFESQYPRFQQKKVYR